jgi:PAS domain S-box-containing protein
MRFTILHKGLLLVSIPLIFEIGLFSYLLHLQNQAEQASRQLNHVRQINDELNSLIRDLVYLMRISTSSTKFGSHMKELNQRFKAMHARMGRLSTLYSDDSKSQAVIRNSDLRITQGEQDLHEAREAISHANPEDPEEFRLIFKKFGHKFEADLLQLHQCGLLELADETSQNASIDASLETREKILIALKCALVLSVLFAATGATLLSRHLVRRVAGVRENASLFAAGQPLLPPLTGNDEIAELDRTFHMAADMIAQGLRKEKAILNNTKEVICSFNIHYKIQSMNSASQELLHSEPEGLLGQNFLNLFADEEKQRIEQELSKTRDSGQSCELESRASRPNTSPVDVSVVVSFSPEDKLYYCSIYDLTSKLELERVRREVTAMITHDLKSPLQSVRSFFEMLALGRFGELNEKGSKLLKMTDQQTVRMFDLIQSVLQLEQLRSGRSTLEATTVDIKGLLEESIETVQLLAEEKEITIDVDLREASACGEAKWIKQIIVNVLVNAINYSPSKSTVRATSQSLDEFSEVRISDKGPGLSEPEKILIFERFNRLGRKSDALGGSGLGLTICKELIALHQGYIKVESEPGQGSTFVLGFPKHWSS